MSPLTSLAPVSPSKRRPLASARTRPTTELTAASRVRTRLLPSTPVLPVTKTFMPTPLLRNGQRPLGYSVLPIHEQGRTDDLQQREEHERRGRSDRRDYGKQLADDTDDDG